MNKLINSKHCRVSVRKMFDGIKLEICPFILLHKIQELCKNHNLAYCLCPM
jgi:hypothetical protein